MAAGVITPPWTDDQVRALNAYQRRGDRHPFTCGGEYCGANLVATRDGWKCPDCNYTQNWAHDFMQYEL